jgi:signal transduction histidine kinase
VASLDLTRAGRRIVASGTRSLLLVDIALAVLLCAGLMIADTRMGNHVGSAESALRTVAVIVVAVSVAARRLSPRLALVVAAASAVLLTALGGAPQASICVALTAYTAANAREYQRWWAPPATASLAVAVGIGVGRVSSWLAALIAAVAVVCVGWFAGQAARERRTRLLAAAEGHAERERQHTAELRQAAIDERLVIARELHDIVAHSMSVIAVRAGVARMVMDNDSTEVKDTLAIIETTTRQALHEMRLLVEVLRHEHATAAALSPAPGLADIGALADQVRLAGVNLRIDVIGASRPLPPEVDLSAYRIAQEALTNVVRHAGPTRATLRIEYGADDVLIEVTDAGPPEASRTREIERSTSAGHGLIGMRERVALYDGHLRTGHHSRGFQVQAKLRTDEATR